MTLLKTLAPVLLSVSAFAASSDEQPDLANSAQWSKLLHYQSNGKSLVRSDKFFFAENGHTDPAAELQASISAFRANPDLGCTYPARYKFLLSKDKLEIPLPECPQLDEWMNEINPDSIKLIFPSAYINNPESMFGHVLLRIDPNQEQASHDLISYAINYAATPDDDNPLAYMIKGFVGSYPGYYSLMPYYRKVREYSDLESRDIWEFDLDLSPDEVKQILEHVWELNDATFDYYYMTKNCTYQVLALIDVVRPELNLTRHFNLRAVPTDAIALLEHEKLIRDTVYRPSYGSKLLMQAEQLRTDLIPYAKALTKGQGDISHLNEQDQADTLELAYEWLNFLYYADANLDRETTAPIMRDLLLKRSQLSAQSSLSTDAVPSTTPAQAHGSARIGLSHQLLDSTESKLFFDYRASYHDSMDPSAGYLPGANLSFLDTQLAIDIEDGTNIYLNRFYLFDVASLSPSNNILNSWSWNGRVGYEREMSQGKGRSYYFAQGGLGKSAFLSNNKLQSYALASMFTASGRLFADSVTLGGGIETGAIWHHNDNYKVGLSAEYLYLSDSDIHHRERYSAEVRYSPTYNYAVTIEGAYERMATSNFAFKVGLYHYF